MQPGNWIYAQAIRYIPSSLHLFIIKRDSKEIYQSTIPTSRLASLTVPSYQLQVAGGGFKCQSQIPKDTSHCRMEI
uniref:Putative ovule protein n=1 Tax=Solanum chacoense TaxID=4108 RepID=A0A0V0HAF2_SOLCH